MLYARSGALGASPCERTLEQARELTPPLGV